MNVLIATSNPHKLGEFHGIFGPLGLGVLGLRDVPGGVGIAEPEETGETFAANARLKALSYARATGMACLADDSGLEVDALGGDPGVHSAYYAGTHGDRAQRDARNIVKLLDALRDVPDEGRGARYVCCVCVASPGGAIVAESRGTFEGRIGRTPRGANGFGYDPLFVTGDGRTAAELSDAEKNDRSHRGAAARAIAPALVRFLRGV